jgi:hypothetical protein
MGRKASGGKADAGRAVRGGVGKPASERGGSRPATPGGGRPVAADTELLARLLELQERTAAVGEQLRAVGEAVATVMRQAAESAAQVVDQLGAAADSGRPPSAADEGPAPEPPAPRPRRRRGPSQGEDG